MFALGRDGAVFVRTPRGNFRGWHWKVCRISQLEHTLRNELARHLDGACEVTLRCGRADVVAGPYVFEVEPFPTWRHGLQQAFAYGWETGLAPQLALFGDVHRDEWLRVFLQLRQIDGVGLWAYDRGAWSQITSRSAAQRNRRMGGWE